MASFNDVVHGCCYAAIAAVEAIPCPGSHEIRLGSYSVLALLPFVAMSHATLAYMLKRDDTDPPLN